MDFNKKEDRENIEKLNRLAGTRHRSKPYDLKNTKDIIEATVMATAEFVDMSNYWSQLVEIDEAFDESLEYYSPAAWIKIGLEGDTEDEDTENARMDLESTIYNFRNLTDRAERKCITMWKAVLNSGDNKVLKHFFGEVINVEDGLVEVVFEEDVIEILGEMNYDGIVEHSADNFAKALKESLLRVKKNLEDSNELF